MPRTVLTVQTPGVAGATPTYSAVDAVNGNVFTWPGVPAIVHIKNTGGSACTMTLRQNGGALGGMPLADRTYAIPATNGDRMVVLTDPAGVVQADGGVYLDWSTATGVSVAVIKTG